MLIEVYMIYMSRNQDNRWTFHQSNSNNVLERIVRARKYQRYNGFFCYIRRCMILQQGFPEQEPVSVQCVCLMDQCVFIGRGLSLLC